MAPANHPDGEASLVLTNGRIHGSVDSGAVHQALAVRDGAVLAVGSDERMLAFAGADTRVIDVGGRTVIPGLNDSHIHAVRAGLTWMREVRWDEIRSLERALDVVTHAARGRPQGAWVAVLGGWHPGQFSEGRLPTKADLDRAAPEHPVFAQLLYDGGVLNTRGVEQSGIEVDDEGRVHGMEAINRCLAAMGEPSEPEQAEASLAFLRHLARWGLTGVVDAGGFGMTPARYEPLRDLWRSGRLPLRVRLYVGPAVRGQEVGEVEAWLEHMAAEDGDELLRTVGIGEIAVYGCHDMEGLTDHTMDEDALHTLTALSEAVARAGRPMQLHAILDSSVGAILDVWENVSRSVPLQDARFSLAHVERISEGNIARAQRLGLGFALQNRLSLRARDSAEAWGDAALRQAPPLGTIREAGLPCGAGTDATRVASPNPWAAIQWFTEGQPADHGPARDPSHRWTRAQALRAYTAGSSWFSHEEHERGVLAPGYLADFAVLSADCFTESALHDMESVLTVVGGEPVHAVGEFAELDPRM